MKITKTKSQLRSEIQQFKSGNPDQKIALVPTMGYLHEGHVDLIRAANQESDLVIVSIFVNPLQFNESSDFENYPINIESDLEICQSQGVGIVFMPTPDEMYTTKPLLQMAMPALCQNLCGKHRPGHFEGVLMVVARLFQLCQPHLAYFGKKDYQQYLVIKQMAYDLDFPIIVQGVPTHRDTNGLALSSRNARLSAKGREHAGLISRAMTIGKNEFEKGLQKPKELCELMQDIIESGTLNKIDYLDIVDPQSLEILDALEPNTAFLIATAVFVEGVRLIDNLEVNF